MSKKQNQKKKVTVKILPGQAVFVADASILNHISETYVNLAESYSDEADIQACMDIANDISEWVAKTYYDPSGDSEDEEW